MSDTTEIAGTLAGLKALDEETIAALQAQLDEEIRLNAMGSEREARLMARLAECERLRATGVEAIRRLNTEVELISIDRDTLRAQLTETRKMLEVQLAVGDKLEAEVKRLKEHLDHFKMLADEWYSTAKKLEAKQDKARKVVEIQALDDGLWFEAQFLTEDYLQKALRRLHEAVEGRTQEECAAEIARLGKEAELAALRERQIPLEAGWKTLAMVIERYPDVLLDFDRQLRDALGR